MSRKVCQFFIAETETVRSHYAYTNCVICCYKGGGGGGGKGKIVYLIAIYNLKFSPPGGAAVARISKQTKTENRVSALPVCNGLG